MMDSLATIFFELIQVSIGVRPALSCSPSEEEWRSIYRLAAKQTIIGVCFSGIQKLGKHYPEQIARLPQILRMRWLAVAVGVQQQNEKLDLLGAELQIVLENNGMQMCILKGQGLAARYCLQDNHVDNSFGQLRQPGDIDVWVKNTNIFQLTEYLHSRNLDYNATVAHVECDFFPGVTVEFHASPAFFRNFFYNRRLQWWIKSYDWMECRREKGFFIPSDKFNLVYLLVHLYHHFLFEGVGFRQLMDYQMLLYSIPAEKRQMLYGETLATLKYLGLLKFTRGVMYVMQEVFAQPDEMALCKPDNKMGCLILKDMLEGGNMGKYHFNKVIGSNNPVVRSWMNFKRNLSFLTISPAEILASPFWSLWHWGWKKIKFKGIDI